MAKMGKKNKNRQQQEMQQQHNTEFGSELTDSISTPQQKPASHRSKKQK
ncbi:hypothetical protein [Halalkalibacter nanhaiisediminis]|uniref:Uncharacterized protein n=1 Tax=Halalkalibacter nanhaiisediminis TaxID=688079 RepID=A0A562Q820_9BACI|nr:hypothetical protein [Halalkalibacter nanhaiisediminis]TWI52892.1 hypothetical protein IQ10_03587 [Halalkalibacter nanhaiisediminis]